MATKHKDPATAGNNKQDIKQAALPIGNTGSMTHRTIRPRPSSPSSGTTTSVPKHGPSKSSTLVGDQLSTKHVPNYLKPTVSSKTDAGKPAFGKKQQHSMMHDDHNMHKAANPTAVRRRSFDKPVPPVSQVHKSVPVHQSRNSKPNASSSSSERVSKVVKAVKSQPPLVKTKSLPKGFASSSKKEAAAVKTANKASEQSPNVVVVTSEAEEEEESLDVNNVEEELARMESPAQLHDHLIQQPPEKHSQQFHVVVDDVDDDHANDHQEKQHNSSSADHEKHDEQLEQEPVAVAGDDDVKVISNNEETREVQESRQNIDEINQQITNGAATDDEAPTEVDDVDTKKEKEEEEMMIKNADAGVGLTAVKTSPDEVVAEGEEDDQELLSAKKSEPGGGISVVVHKRQIGGPISKKESPAYNDVIEKTASKLVEKRVNKVRALAGAFETVISLEQPHSS